MAKTKTSFKKGNKVAQRLKTPDRMIAAYKCYCKHIANGRPKEAWYFDDEEDPICWATMEKYIKENSAVLKPIKMQVARSKSYTKWFDDGEKLMKGGYKNASPNTWATIMRNMFDWDKSSQVSHTFEPEARRLLARLEGK